MSDHAHNLQLIKLDEKVRRLRNTAANFDWDCRALIEEIESLDQDTLCDVLKAGFGELKKSVETMNETMAVMGNNMMGCLNTIAMHITAVHVEAQMRKAQAEALAREGADSEEEPGEPKMEEMH